MGNIGKTVSLQASLKSTAGFEDISCVQLMLKNLYPRYSYVQDLSL